MNHLILLLFLCLSGVISAQNRAGRPPGRNAPRQEREDYYSPLLNGNTHRIQQLIAQNDLNCIQRAGNEAPSTSRVPDNPRTLCCNEDQINQPTETIQIERGGATLSFQVTWVNEGTNFTNLDHATHKLRIQRTLERLPTAHLRVIQPIRLVIGRRCNGGGSLPCRDASGNPGPRACFTLSYECFRDQTDSGAFECSGSPSAARGENNGSWDENKQVLGTLLHEIGHFIDYHYAILDNLHELAKKDCRYCAACPSCYNGGTIGASETIAEAYMTYFLRTTYRAVLGCPETGDCTSTLSPREGAHPSPARILTSIRINYLINSLAWENWN
jgi:hypothetical protein